MKTNYDHTLSLDDNLVRIGLDWEPVKEKLLRQSHDKWGTVLPVEGTVALTKGLGGRQLGIIGENQAVWGTRQMVVDMVEAGNEMGTPLNTVSVLRGGEDIIGTYRSREWDILGDRSKDELALSDNLVGKRKALAYAFFERVVCTNGMTMMVRSEAASARHTTGFRLQKDRMILALAEAQQASLNWEEFNRRMAGWRPSSDQLISLVSEAHDVLSPRPTDDDKVARWETARLAFMSGVGEVYRSRTIQESRAALGTAFGAFNAVTEYLDRPRARVKDRESAIMQPFSAGNKQKQAVQAMFETNLELSAI